MDIRIPTPINSNPGMVLPPRKFTTVNDVARFAAQVINGIMEYKEKIDRYFTKKEIVFILSKTNNRFVNTVDYYAIAIVESYKKSVQHLVKRINHFVWHNTIVYWARVEDQVIPEIVNIYQSQGMIIMSLLLVEIRKVL